MKHQDYYDAENFALAYAFCHMEHPKNYEDAVKKGFNARPYYKGWEYKDKEGCWHVFLGHDNKNELTKGLRAKRIWLFSDSWKCEDTGGFERLFLGYTNKNELTKGLRAKNAWLGRKSWGYIDTEGLERLFYGFDTKNEFTKGLRASWAILHNNNSWSYKEKDKEGDSIQMSYSIDEIIKNRHKVAFG